MLCELHKSLKIKKKEKQVFLEPCYVSWLGPFVMNTNL